MNITKSFILIAAVLSLSACATDSVNNRNYQFQKNATNGLAALAVECTGSGMVDIVGAPDTNSLAAALLEQDFATVNCKDGVTSYKLINLNPGRYSISQINPVDEFSVLSNPIKFSVFPGKVNYIGHLKMEITPSEKGAPEGGVHWALFDNAHDDIPIFQAKFPNISPKKYKIFGK